MLIIRLRVAILFIFTIFSGAFVYSQSLKYSSFHCGHGLPSMEVYCVKQSVNGLLWFTSDRGIFNYNGTLFNTFTTQNGLGDNTNFSIFERSDSSLWFNGYNGSLTVLKDGVFQTHKPISDFIRSKHFSNWIKDCWFDNNSIYFKLTNNDQIYRYDEQSSSFSTLSIPTDVDTVKYGNFTFISKQTPEGSNDIYRLRHYHDSTFFYTVDGHLHTAFVSKNGDLKTLTSIELPQAQEYKTITPHPTEKNAWFVSSNEGLYLFKKAQGKLLISDINVSSVTSDADGNIWFTSIGKGVVRIPASYMRSVDELNDQPITAISRFDDALIVGTRSGQTLILKEGKVKQVLGSRSYVPVEKIVQWSDILATSSLFRQNNYGEWGSAGILPGMIMKATVGVNDSTLYVGSSTYLHEYKTNGTTRKIPTVKEQIGQIKDLEYTKGHLWIGTMNGLWHAPCSDHVLSDPQPHQPFPELKGRIEDITPHNKGLIISVLGIGLVYYDGNNLTAIRHSEINHITLINKVISIGNSKLLLLSNTGVALIELDNRLNVSNVYFLDEHDGLNSNMVYDASLSDDSLYLATGRGVNVLPTCFFNQSFPRPRVHITGLSTTGPVTKEDGVFVLSPKQDNFSVYFQSISLSRSDFLPSYRYALVNEYTDTNWTFLESPVIHSANVKPGHYNLLVSARNKNSSWSEPAQLAIFLKPHFTQTPLFIILIILCTVLIVGLLWYYYARITRKRQQQELNIEKLNSRSAQMELFALQSQMNPHFIFNALNAIQRYVITRSFPIVNEYIDKLAKLMRQGLLFSSSDYVTLEEEITYLKNYLDLESRRFYNLFEWSVTPPGQMNYRIPPLLIQPVVENAIKHGFKHITEGGLVSVVFHTPQNELIKVEVRDNGVGTTGDINREEEPGWTPLGLSNVRKRLALFGEQTNQEDVGITIESTDEGTLVTLILPCITA